MEYSKVMIELIYEIRRCVPLDMKPSIKFSNPEVLGELGQYYWSGADASAKALIKELLTQAGEPWRKIISEKDTLTSSQVSKTYRGQTRLEELKSLSQAGGNKPLRIYRGQVVR